MSDVVIRAEGLGKKYVIGHEAAGERYTALRDVIARQARRFARSAADMARGRALVVGETREEFWALRDVNFEIRRGEVVGIIGRNGAGKSTLLKVLSRITEPTEGRVTIEGRVASLLEVGTGFHPELTGRENIFLNGAILGMTRAEIRRKFDEIVDFAGVEKFIDTPVKRYSSGMKVRLGFSVAAHLEPEILIVDEVLAVGDAEFQKKCLGKMEDVSGQGRTVLFVSHNMGAMKGLCPRGVLLRDGLVTMDGEINEVVDYYLVGDNVEKASTYEADDVPVGGVYAASLLQDDVAKSVIDGAKPFTLRLFLNIQSKETVNTSIKVIMTTGETAIHTSDEFMDFKEGVYRQRECHFPKKILRPGKYYIEVQTYKRKVKWYEHYKRILHFEVTPSGHLLTFNQDWKGLTCPDFFAWAVDDALCAEEV